MRFGAGMIAVMTGILLAQGASAVQVMTVENVEIRGLRYQSRSELLRGVKMTAVPGGIAVDLDTLRSALGDSRMLKTSEIRTSGRTLVIEVEEREPARIAALRRGDRLVPLELDADFTIISVNRIHGKLGPAVILEDADMVKGTVSDEIRDIYRLLDRVRSLCPGLYGEISDVRRRGDGNLVVRLNGRRTAFVVAPEAVQFSRLRFIVGYIDARRMRPRRAALADTRALIAE
ncbi:MAG: hypothetical protein JXA20_18010 [Spirochaetes bacterium]|nr:hypothetical protein [Spirochaetota bacterium]